MYRVVYVNNLKTWRESRASDWYKSVNEVQRFLDGIHHKTMCAENIRVQEIIDVTNRFKLPQAIGTTESAKQGEAESGLGGSI